MTNIKLLLIFAVGIFTFNLINCLNKFLLVITESDTLNLCRIFKTLYDLTLLIGHNLCKIKHEKDLLSKNAL